MKNDQAPQERLLEAFASIAEALNRQVGQSQTPDSPQTLGKAIKEPAVLAALITVLIGGIAATLITGIIQWRAGVREFDQSQLARDRDFEQAWLKSRGDQALLSYKEYLDQEKDLIRRTYSSIGSCIAASDRLTGLTRGVWRKHFLDPAAVEKQKQEIRDNYNQSNAKWHSEGEEIGLLMGYYHPGKPNVTNSWSNVQEAVTDYLDCAQHWYDKYPPTQPAPNDEAVKDSCKQQHTALTNKLIELTASLESARRYAWTGWESPQELKATLYGKSP